MKKYVFTRQVISNETFNKGQIVALTPSQVSTYELAKAIKPHVEPKGKAKEKSDDDSKS